MKIAVHVSLAFKELPYSKKVPFGYAVIDRLSGTNQKGQPVSDFFPNLPVPLAELKSISDEVAGYLAEALSGLRTAKEALKASIKEWNNAFTLTANYVNMVAHGDNSLIVMAGFNSTKNERSSKPRPDIAGTFQATVGGGRSTINAGIKKTVKVEKALVLQAVV